MCGITAYVGKKRCQAFVLEGLSRLEYRGYDSAGFVCIDQRNNHISYAKEPGRLSALKERLQHVSFDGCTGMGHTRWATHGVASKKNAHPHFDCKKTIALVHNGIIEHSERLRNQLVESGHELHSDTDSEAVAHLLEQLLLKHDSLQKALIALVKQLKGAFALVIMLEEFPDRLIAIRRKSPLVIGIGSQEMYVGSDSMVFADKTNQVVFLPDSSCAIVKMDHIDLFDFSGSTLSVDVQTLDIDIVATSKQGFAHYMLKEIYEQKQAITRTVRSVSDRDDADLCTQMGITTDQIESLKEIHLVACGTSWHAACMGQFYFEEVLGLPVRVHLASEFRYKAFFAPKESLFIGISQSGETADTLEALRMVRERGITTIALTNVASSTMIQESDGFILMQAGPEISVCSTKAFSAQLACLYWLAHWCGKLRAVCNTERYNDAINEILVAAQILEASIELYKRDIQKALAKYYATFDRIIFLGRHLEYPFAMEAALKLKEISYIFAQAYPAGELKHGPIALIDKRTPVVVFSSLDPTIYQKTLANAQEVKARDGHLLVFAYEGQEELINLADNVFVVPRVVSMLGPLAMTGLMQYLMYEIACVLDLPIDKPRNLAKSVTVE